jgi:hypothetical protein
MLGCMAMNIALPYETALDGWGAQLWVFEPGLPWGVGPLE